MGKDYLADEVHGLNLANSQALFSDYWVDLFENLILLCNLVDRVLLYDHHQVFEGGSSWSSTNGLTLLAIRYGVMWHVCTTRWREVRNTGHYLKNCLAGIYDKHQLLLGTIFTFGSIAYWGLHTTTHLTTISKWLPKKIKKCIYISQLKLLLSIPKCLFGTILALKILCSLYISFTKLENWGLQKC